MKLTKIITYVDEEGNKLSFVPVKDVPGYTHKVIYNDKKINWLSSYFNPTEKAAAYYIKTEKERQENQP
jgi:hypothetical protein